MTIKNGWYKHFKGGYYYVVCMAKHSETLEDMVVYYHKGEPELWVRPVSMWTELIDKEPRFKYITDNFVYSDGECTYSFEPKEVKDYE